MSYEASLLEWHQRKLVEASTLKRGDMGRWKRDSRRFVVVGTDGFKIIGRYLDNGEKFHTHGMQPIVKIKICWWMGVE